MALEGKGQGLRSNAVGVFSPHNSYRNPLKEGGLHDMRKAITCALVTMALCFSIGAGKAHAAGCLGAAPEAPDTIGYNYDGEQDNWFHYEAGMKWVEVGDWHSAAGQFNYYILMPRYHRGAWGAAYFGFGVMHEKQGNFEAAIDCYRLAVSRDRNPRISVADKAYQNIGTIYLKKKNYPKAIENYKKAIEKNSANGYAHYYLGMSYLKSGDLENAEKESQEAKKRGITFPALDKEINEARNHSTAIPSDALKEKNTNRKATN